MPVEESFPEPVVYEPPSGIHKHTVILLHGRGGSADAFGPALLNTAFPLAYTVTRTQGAFPRGRGTDHPAGDGIPAEPADHHSRPTTTLAGALPHARFVFPSAPRQRATIYRRSVIRQWFDDWHLGFAVDQVDGRYDMGLQTTGLGRAVAYLHGLVAEEAALVGGARNVILGGISQGCAASLVASLLWEGREGLGGVVGMCGWLPYISQMRGQMEVAAEDDGIHCTLGRDPGEDGFDPFDRSVSPGCDVEPPRENDAGGSVGAALEWLGDEIDLPRREVVTSDVSRSSIPIILCHGRDDQKVDIGKGSESAEFLIAIGMRPPRLKEYAGVGHDFSAEMLSDIAEFTQDVLDQPSS